MNKLKNKYFDNTEELYEWLESMNELYGLVEDGNYATFDDVNDYFNQHKDEYKWGEE